MIQGKEYVRARNAHWINFKKFSKTASIPTSDDYVLGVACERTEMYKRHTGDMVLFEILNIEKFKFRIKVSQNCNVYWQIY